jgi:MFS family permease
MPVAPPPLWSRRHPVWLVLGCLLCQMGAGFFYASRTLSADVISELGWTRTTWASGTAPMLVVSSIGQAFVGAACARFGVRRVIVASLACMSASVALFWSMQDVPTFYLSMMLLALANAGLGDVSIGSVITRWFGRWRSVALGFALVGSNLGAVVYIGALGMLLGGMGWRGAALAVGLGGAALILPFAALVIREPAAGEGAEAEPAASEHAGSREGEGGSASVELGTAAILRMPAFWILSFSLFCYALVQLGLIDQFVLYLTDLGYTTTEASGALQLAFGAGVASKLGAGFVGQVLPARTAYTLNTGLLALSLVLVPFASDAWVLTLFSVAFGLSSAARDVLLALAVGERFGPLAFARVYGLMNLAFVPGGALGPLVLAGAHRAFGDYRPGFFACIGLTLAAVMALALLSRLEPAARSGARA